MKTILKQANPKQKKANTKKYQSILHTSNGSCLVNLKSRKDVKRNLMWSMCKNELVANCHGNICLECVGVV